MSISPPTTPPPPPSEASSVILVRTETSPEDVHGMLASEGILTARGGLVSHAAVVARGWGKPAVVGAEKVRIVGALVHGGRRTVVHEGDWISIDGTAGEVVLGQVPLAEAKASEEFETLLGGPTTSARGTSACAPTPTTVPTPPTPGAWGPRGSACAGPSTCSSPRTGCPSCAG